VSGRNLIHHHYKILRSSAFMTRSVRSRFLGNVGSLSLAPDAVSLLLGLLPLFLTAHLPLSDLPNHLARQYIIRDIFTSPILQKFYFVHWQLVPNLALELFVIATRSLFGIQLSVRLFCILSLVMIFFGVRWISYSLGHRDSRIYLASPILFYGGPFQFGFLSFCFGVGISLCLFGFYIPRRRRPVSAVALIVVGFYLLLCHIAAFGLFCAAVVGYEIGCLIDDWVGQKRRPALLSIFSAAGFLAIELGLPLLIFLLLAPAQNVHFFYVDWGTWRTKAEAVLAVTLFSAPICEIGLLAVAFLAVFAGLASGAVRVDRRCLPMLAIFALLFLVMPRNAWGGGYIDYRIPWAASLYFLASLHPGLQRPRLARLLAALAGALFIARVATISILWLQWEPVIAGIDTALAKLPVGATLMVVQGDPGSISVSRRPSLLHVAAYAVARRQAFEPQLYASLQGQILYFQPYYRVLWRLSAPNRLDSIAPDYDHVLVLRPRFAEVAPELPLTLIASGKEFELFRVGRL
jgi:hypothetical protein